MDGSGSKWLPILKVQKKLYDNHSEVQQNCYRRKAFAILLSKMPQEFCYPMQKLSKTYMKFQFCSSFFISFSLCITQNYKTCANFLHTKQILYFCRCAMCLFWFKAVCKSWLVMVPNLLHRRVLSATVCIRNKPCPSFSNGTMFKTQSSSPENREHFRLYNMLGEDTLSFSTLNSDTSQKDNIIAMWQALWSLGQSCHSATKRWMSLPCDKPR